MTYYAQAKELGWTPPPRADSQDSGEGRGGKDKGPQAAVIAMGLAQEAGDTIWLDLENRPHVTFTRLPEGSDRPVAVHVRIDSQAYRKRLSALYFRHHGDKVLSEEQVKRAIELLQYTAEEAGIRYPTFMRVGKDDTGLYVDLGRADGQVVKVTAEDWTVVPESPVRFIRGNRGELPIPEPGGTLEDFSKHLNLSPADMKRFLMFVISTYNVVGPYMILMIQGPSGTGKSGVADITAALSDPPRSFKTGRFSMPPDARTLHIHALHTRLVLIDNVSSIDADMADALCLLSTGVTSSHRVLYTMEEEMQIHLVRPIVLTGISMPSGRSDMLNRTLAVSALPIARRLPEAVLLQEFMAAWPKLLGFILTAVSHALRNADTIAERYRSDGVALPRMGDAAAFVEGAAELLGLQPGELSKMLSDEQAGLQAEAAMGEPVVIGLVDYFQRGGTALHMTSAELLKLLRERDIGFQKWPAVGWVRDRLRRNKDGLAALGIVVEEERPAGHRNVWRFRIQITDAFETTTPTLPANAFTGNPNRPLF